MLDRLVTPIEPPPEYTARQTPQAFRDFLSGHTIILLGDPGVGKTHLFQHAARHEGAAYTTVRQCVVFEGENCKGKTVYLDALDEFRLRSGDNDTAVEKLVRIVRSLGRPKIRLSCRAADWLGNTDLLSQCNRSRCDTTGSYQESPDEKRAAKVTHVVHGERSISRALHWQE